jgi:hypothetical protein
MTNLLFTFKHILNHAKVLLKFLHMKQKVFSTAISGLMHRAYAMT